MTHELQIADIAWNYDGRRHVGNVCDMTSSTKREFARQLLASAGAEPPAFPMTDEKMMPCPVEITDEMREAAEAALNDAVWQDNYTRGIMVLEAVLPIINQAVLTAWNKRVQPEGGEAEPIGNDHPLNGSRWRHLKTGGVYTFLGSCQIEATNTPAYLYQSEDTGTVWARPMDEFLDGRFECLSARALSSDTGGAAATQGDDYERGVNDMREACAKLIEDYIIMDHSAGEKTIRPRPNGEVSNLAYALAIRTLPSPTISSGSAK